MDEIILRSLEGATTAEEERELARWLAASEAHERQYQELLRLHEAARALRRKLHATSPPDPERFLSELDRRIIARRGARVRRGVRAPWALVTAAAAAAVVLAVGVAELRSFISGDELRDIELVTGPGEMTTATLGQGRAVRLAPESRLRVSRIAGELDVWLEGRAYFSIAHQQGQTFRVRTEGGDALVLGTRFDLEARHGDVRVVVVEGKVRVTTPRSHVDVGPSEMGVAAEGRPPTVEPVEDVHTHLSWMQDFIAFEGTPLREVADELERRFEIRVEIRGEELAKRQVTGWSAGRPIDEMLDAICRTIAARCSLVDGKAVIEP